MSEDPFPVSGKGARTFITGFETQGSFMISYSCVSAATSLTGFVRTGSVPAVRTRKTGEKKVYHMIAEVRKREGIPIKKCAKLLGISVEEAREQEDPATPLTAAQLSEWKRALKVPYSEFYGRDDDDLDDPIRNRAGMLKAMKSAKSLREMVRCPSERAVVDNLIGQLTELMPELAKVSAWPKVGQSHEAGRFGRTVTDEYSSTTAKGTHV